MDPSQSPAHLSHDMHLAPGWVCWTWSGVASVESTSTQSTLDATNSSREILAVTEGNFWKAPSSNKDTDGTLTNLDYHTPKYEISYPPYDSSFHARRLSHNAVFVRV